ncbi:hypothetical protein BC834DRAFT_973475 [Gloeopeniophorella convolvens]|nr:hypothetical protein BC834DRAFT_973475 [Gloeopeniophorella convolvens]
MFNFPVSPLTPGAYNTNGHRVPLSSLVCGPRSRQDTDLLIMLGGMFGLLGEMWKPINKIITTGIESSREGTLSERYKGNDAYFLERNRNRKLFRVLLYVVPDLIDQCRKCGPSGPRRIGEALDGGRRQIHSNIVRMVQRSILDWHDWDGDMSEVVNKANRGFNHAEFGRLLCPASYNWNDEKVRLGLQTNDKEYPVGASDWPAFMWEDPRNIDTDQLLKGFLRGQLIVKAVRSILFRPVSTRNGNQPKPGNLKYPIREVTFGIVTYAVTIVRFALSSEPTFYPGGSDGKWPYQKFYTSIVAIITAMDPEDRKELKEWWNLQVFGHRQGHVDEDNLMETALVEAQEEDSVMWRMIAQMHTDKVWSVLSW